MNKTSMTCTSAAGADAWKSDMSAFAREHAGFAKNQYLMDEAQV
jgi:hypothetical protein